MPAAQSKEAPQSEEQAKKVAEQRVNALCKHLFFNVFTLTINVQADPALFTELFAGDMAKVASFIGTCTAASSALEFLFNPTIGAWSDGNGRKPALLLGPALNATFPALLALLPASVPLAAAVRVVSNIGNAISGTTSSMAALADTCQGDRAMLTGSTVKMLTSAGMAVILGPATGGIILARSKPSTVYAMKALMSLLHFLWLKTTFSETLTETNKRLFDGSFKSPFNFFELFTKTPMLRSITIFNLLQCFVEGKCVNDLNQMWMKGVLDWDVPTAARWTVGYGVMMVMNGIASKILIGKHVQPRTFVSVSSLFGIVAMSIKGSVHAGWAYTLGLLLNTPCINASGGAPIKALGMLKAGQAGMGNADYASKFANLRAVIYVIGPQTYLRIFAAQIAAKRNPGAAYFLAAVLGFVIPELMHRQWSDADFK